LGYDLAIKRIRQNYCFNNSSFRGSWSTF